MAVFNTNRIKNLIKTKHGSFSNKGSNLVNSSSSWLKNATMSIGVSLKDVGAEMMPTTFESVRNVTTEFSSMYTFLRDFKSDGGVDNLTNAFNNNEYTTMIKSAFSNIKADLKSGNLNNKDREMEAFMGDFGDISDDEYTYNDEFDSSIENGGSEDEISFAGDSATPDAIADTFVAQTQAMTSGLKGVAEVNYALGRTQLQLSKESFIQVGQGLQAINDNLALLVNYNNEVITAYTQTSMKYYDDHMGAVKAQLELQQKLLTPNAPPEKEYGDNPTEDLLYGGLSLEKLGNVIKANFKDYTDSNLVLSMGKMALGNTDMLKPMIANPIGFATQSLISSVIPKAIKETLGAMEESISNFIPALMMRFNRDKMNYSNPLMQFIGSLFGIKSTVKKTIDLSKYNNGPIPFDGETKKAIIEVVPGYLRKILAAITGQEERIFDHNTNTFRTVKEVQKDFDDAKRNSALYEYSDSIDKIMDKADFLDTDQQKQFKSKVQDFMLKLSESDNLLDLFGLIGKGSGFDLTIKNGKVNNILDKAFKPTEEAKKKQEEIKNTIKSANDFADLANKANMNDSEANLLMEIIRSMKKGDVMKLFGRDVLSARSSVNEFMTRLEDDPNRFLAASLLGEGKLPFNDHLDEDGGIKKGFGLFNPLDKFGKNSLDYLRNIQDILVDGIKVFIAGNTEGDTSHLNKYKNEKPANSKIIEEKKTSGSDISTKITDLTQEEIVKGIKSSDEKKKEDNRTWLSKAVDNIIGKSSNETTKQRLMSVKEFFNKPMNMIQSIAKKIDESLFNIVFGKDDSDIIDPETGEIKRGTSFISAVGTGLTKFFTNTQDWVINKIYNPLKEALFGKEGIITQIKDSKLYQYGKEKWEKGKDYIFGEKDEDGNRQNGIGSKVYNESRDILKGMAYYFTGKSYKKSTGEIVPDNEKSVFGEMNKVFSSISNSIKLKWFGEKDEDGNYKEDQKGIITKGLDSLYEGFRDFGKLIFGNKFGTDDELNAKDFAKKFKDGLPKSLAWGGIGAALSVMSPLGFMGSLFLPGGMVGGAIVGMASGFLSQSESFKNWLFGPQDPNDMNNRMGGIISASTQKFLKDNKIHIAAGAGIGAIKGMIGGGGLLGSLFIGGPVGGALMGMGTAMIARSETFQRFMFGDLDENGNRTGGILSKLKFNYKSKDKSDNTGGRMVAGMLGGSALGALVSQFGLLGSALTLGSGPLFGAVAGAAAGLSLSSKKFTNLMFGEIDEVTGKRRGGIVTKTLNKMTVSLLGPVRDAFDGLKIKAGEWFSDKILLPIQVAMDPILAQFKFLGDAVKDIFSKTLNTLNSFIKDNVVTPIGTTLKMLLNPIGKLLKVGLGTGVKLGANLLATPFSLLEGFAGMVQGKQQKRGVRKYKESIDEDYRETRNAAKFRKGKLSEEDWRSSVQKKKGYMNDDQWNEYRDSYKDRGKLSKFSAIRAKYFDKDARREAMFGEEGAYYADGKSYKERLKDIRQKNSDYFEKRRQKLEEQKAQTEMRRQYAEAYGYDNFDSKGNDKSFIYDPSTYFKKNEKTGEIEAWRDEAKTQQSKDTEDIKFNTDKLVALVEKNAETNKDIVTAISQKDEINSSNEPKTFAEKATDIIKSNTSAMVDKLSDVESWLKVIAGVSDKSVTDLLSTSGLSTLEESDLPSNLQPSLPEVNDITSLVPIQDIAQSFNIPGMFDKYSTNVLPDNRLLPAPTAERDEESQEEGGIKTNLPALISPITETIAEVTGHKQAEDKTSLFDGKDVLEYQKEQEELKEKEKNETFTSVMMDSILAMKDSDKKFHFEWSSIFGKKGLITAALLAGIPLLMKLLGFISDKLGDNGGDIEGSINSGDFANNPGGPNEGVWVNEDGTVTPIYNTQLRENLSQWAAKTGIKLYDKIPSSIKNFIGKAGSATGKVIKKGAKLVGNVVSKVTSPITTPIRNFATTVADRFKENVSGTRLSGKYTGEILSSMPDSKVTGEVVSNALTSSSADRWLLSTGSTIAKESTDDVIDVAYKEVSSNKNVVQTVATNSKSLLNKFKNIIIEAFDAITTNKTFIKYLNSTKTGSTACSNALKSMVEKVLKSIPAKYTARIVSAVSKFAATTAAEIGTGGVAAIVFGVYDFLTGATKSEAANLFQVNQDDVDFLMRGISSAVKVILGLGNLGPIADIFSEIFSDVTGFSIKTWCASKFYEILSGGNDEELKLAQEAFTKEYQQAIEESGNLNTTKQEYNNMVNKTWWAKYVSDPVSKTFGWNDESVQKKFMDREDFDAKTTKITFSDRLASATGSIAKIVTLGIGGDKVDKYVANKVKSGFDYVKNMFTPKQRNAQGQAYNQAKLSELKKTIDEWNSMDCLSEETRLSMADEEYWVMVYNYMEQVGYSSPTEMTEEDMIQLFGDYSQGELPDSLKKKYGLDQYNQPGYKWTINKETGEIEVHDIYDVELPEDGSIRVNDETGLLEIDYEKVPVIEGWKGRSIWDNTKRLASKVASGVKNAVVDFVKDPAGSIKKGISAIGTGIKKVGKKIGDGISAFDDKFLNGKGKEIKAEISKKVDKIKDKAIDVWDDIKSGVDNVTDSTIIAGFKDDTIRETLGLDENTKITLKDRFAVSVGGFLEGITGGKVDKEDSSKVIYGAVEMAQEKAVEIWTNLKDEFSDWVTDAKKNIKEGLKKADQFIGNVFGFTDKDGNPMSLSEKVGEKVDEFKENTKELINKVKNFSFTDFWSNFKEDTIEKYETFKTNIKTGFTKADMFIGNVFGFTDKDGNPMKLSEKIDEQVDQFKENTKEVISEIKSKASETWKNFKENTKENFNKFTTNFGEGVKKADMFLGNVFGFTDKDGKAMTLSEKVNEKTDEFQGVMTTMINNIKKTAEEGWSKFTEKLGVIIDAIKEIPGKIDEALGSWFSGEKNKKLTTLVKEKLNVVGSFFDNLITSVKSFFGVATDKANSSINSRNTGSGTGKGIDSLEEMMYDKLVNMQGAGNTTTTNITNAKYVTCPNNVSNVTNNNSTITNAMTGRGSETSATATGMRISGKYGLEDKVHNFAYNSQSDPRWASYNYGLSPGVSGTTSNPTMAARACGPTAFSMVASQLNNQNYSPVEMADNFRKSGHSLPGGTTGAAMVDMAKKYGINGRYDSTTSAGIRNAITSNKPMILLGNRKSSDVSSSPFTSGGHFVTAVGIAGNKVLINDPRGKAYSKAYDLNKVANETRAAWSYTGGNPTILPNSAYDDFSEETLNRGSQAYKLKNKSDAEKVKIYEDLGWNEFTNFLNSKSITEPNDPITYKIDSTQYSGLGDISLSNYSSARMRSVQDAVNGLKNDGYLAAYSALYGNNDALVSLSNLDETTFNNTIEEFRAMSNDEFKDRYGVKLNPAELLAGNGEGGITTSYTTPNIRASANHLVGLGEDYNSLTGLGPTGADIVASARKLIGKPYVYGGNYSPLGSSRGTDCSGLCQWAYNDNGIKISRTTYTQIKDGREVKKEDLQPGDLVFSRWDGSNFQHVVLYAGNGKVIEAQKTGTTISERNLNWQSTSRARRILSDSAAKGTTSSSSTSSSSTDSSSSEIVTTTTEAVSSNPTLFQKLTTAMSQVFNGVTNSVVYGEDYEGLDWDEINGITYTTTTTAKNIEGSTESSSDGSTSYGSDDTGKLLQNFHNLSGIFEVGGQSPSSISSFNERSGYISNGASWGDAGGNSYGLPQFTIPTGSLKGFVNWLQSAHPEMGSKLSGKTLGSSAFNTAWKGLASEAFKLAQWEYTDRNYFTPGLKSAQSKGVLNTDTITMKSVINSNAKAKGTADSMFGRIMKAGANKSLQPAITAMYQNVKDNAARDYRSSSASVQQSWRNRAEKEKNFALAMAKREAPGKGGDSSDLLVGAGNLDSKLRVSPIVNNHNMLTGKGEEIDPVNKFINKNRYKLEKLSKKTGKNLGFGSTEDTNISLKTPNKAKLYTESKSYTSPVESFVNTIATTVSDSYSASMVDKELSLSTPSSTTSNVREVLLSNNSTNNNLESLLSKSLELLSSIASNTSDTVNAVKSQDLSVTVQQTDSGNSNGTNGSVNIIAPNGGNTSVNATASKDNSSNRNLERAMAIARGRF